MLIIIIIIIINFKHLLLSFNTPANLDFHRAIGFRVVLAIRYELVWISSLRIDDSIKQGWAANSTPGIYQWHLPVYTDLENTPQVANTGKYRQIEIFFGLKKLQKSLNKLH